MKSCQHSESSAVLGRIIFSRFGGLFFRVTCCNQTQMSDVEGTEEANPVARLL